MGVFALVVVVVAVAVVVTYLQHSMDSKLPDLYASMIIKYVFNEKSVP